MTLYASSPDLLAQQQFNLDQLYGNAGARNAAAVTDVASQNVNAVLAQRKMDSENRNFNVASQQRADELAQNLAYGTTQGELNRKSNLDVVKFKQDYDQKNYEEAVLREAAKLAESGQLSASSANLYHQALSPGNQARLADIIHNSAATFDASQRAAVQPYVDQRAGEQAFADRGNSIAAALAFKPQKPVVSPVVPAANWSNIYNIATNPLGAAARYAGRLVTPESPTIQLDPSGMESRLAALKAMTAEKNPRIQIMPDQSFGPVTTVPAIQPSELAAAPTPIPVQAPVIQSSTPNPVDIAYLLKNRSDPRILRLFESRFGAGSSGRYLNQQN